MDIVYRAKIFLALNGYLDTVHGRFWTLSELLHSCFVLDVESGQRDRGRLNTVPCLLEYLLVLILRRDGI